MVPGTATLPGSLFGLVVMMRVEHIRGGKAAHGAYLVVDRVVLMSDRGMEFGADAAAWLPP
jgi:hypothetical protein